ncbi:hypothetical protein [Streptacidiphilus sp. EB129]|uniref:hypothetical protein n=1 Tax=Streptacidiphilus sp. EB129 TaxID=3156262 RepID=UPI0035122569
MSGNKRINGSTGPGVTPMAYRLNRTRLYAAAELLGDMTDAAIRDRTGISLGTFSRLVNLQVEPAIRYLHVLSEHYGVPVKELYEEVPTATAGAVA